VLEDFESVEQHTDVGGIKSIISVPFFSKNKVIGLLMLSSKESRTISKENQSILEAISRDIGTAISKFITEQELIAKQLSLMSIFDALVELLLVVDGKSGYLVMANKAAKEEFGLSDKQLTKMTIFELLAMPSNTESSDILTMFSDKTGEFSLLMKTADGEKIDYNISYYSYTVEKRDVYVCILRTE